MSSDIEGMTEAEILAGVPEVLERDGWIKGDFYSEQGRCVMGACLKAAGLRPVSPKECVYSGFPAVVSVRERLTKVAKDLFPDRFDGKRTVSIETFNDHELTTLSEVLTVLEKTRIAAEERA